MNALNDLLSPALLQAIGFTLLHSLWQGTLVALTASVLLLLLHRHRATVRYRVLLGALSLVVALAAVTFVGYFQAAPSALTVGRTPLPSTTSEVGSAHRPGAKQAQASEQAPLADLAPAVLAEYLTYLEQNMPLLVCVWLLGLLAMTLRFLASLAYVRRLRTYRVAALPEAWQQRVDALCTQAGVARRVQVVASSFVPSPVIVGYVKPIILLPISAATGLSPRELEMILAHEVAHVLRQDYLINLLQALAEVLFFYPPAVWFLSGALRAEREHCCDYVATQLCGDPYTLAQALSSLAELAYSETHAARLALAATGARGESALLGRVRRLVTPSPAAPAVLEGFWFTCVVLVSTALLVGSTLASVAAAAHPVYLPYGEQSPVTTPANLLEVEMKKDGLLPNPHRYEYTLRAHRLVINGTVQPAAVAAKYRRLYETASGETLWPLLSSLYRNVHDEAPTTGSALKRAL